MNELDDDRATIPISTVLQSDLQAPLGLDFDVAVPATSLKVRRERRRMRPRSKTIAMKRMTRAELAAGARAYPREESDELDRPRTRAQCQGEQRPCPWV